MLNKQVAIIDMGSNSIRLVINKIDSNGYYNELHNFKIVARLSAHIDDAGNLSKSGIQTVLDTLKRFKDVIQFHRVTQVTIIATAAMRKANNRKEIVKLVKEKIGFDIRILSEYEEAFYGYLAVINSTSIENGFTVDIGGGSTEITLFENRELKHYHSFPFGAITLHQQFFSGEQSQHESLALLNQYIKEQLNKLPWLNKNKHYPVIGIGGSARNLSLIHQRKNDYPLAGLHQYEFPGNELQELNEMLQQLSVEERLNLDGLSKDRVDIIVPAAEVITAIVNQVNANTFIMSRKGLREGVFYEELLKTMETSRFPNVVEESLYQLSNSYELNVEHVNHISLLANELYLKLHDYIPLHHSKQEAAALLNQSARLLYIGEYINNEASSENTFYLLTNMTIEGLSHKERLAIALISSYKSKNRMQNYAKTFNKIISKKELKYYEFLGSILKLAYSLDRTRRKVVTTIGDVTENDKGLSIELHIQNDAFFEDVQATKNKKHLERAINYPIEFRYVPLEVLNTNS
ncbi:exopolyphosphatase [Alkalihalobacillus sp. MEB130]|uniref:exopolyphosphatase n=1 Tax=Alkalihalobacillus sp. MEB130 TaxID=2976704 RepID=UPI0028DFE96F|nr:exopolyphosphatase [Alkalihalobacillus sp. MEB130]MDT8861756.1 exopolyphosphatase [Alkalihalobacillus sp. MEB130]